MLAVVHMKLFKSGYFLYFENREGREINLEFLWKIVLICLLSCINYFLTIFFIVFFLSSILSTAAKQYFWLPYNFVFLLLIVLNVKCCCTIVFGRPIFRYRYVNFSYAKVSYMSNGVFCQRWQVVNVSMKNVKCCI